MIWIRSGKISIRGKDGQLREVTINSPQDAVKYGIGYLSEDRRRYGCVVQKSVTENTTLATMEEFTSGIFINKSKEKEVSEKYVKELATKTPNCRKRKEPVTSKSVRIAKPKAKFITAKIPL